MSDKGVKVKSLVKGIVGIKSQDLRINLTWNKRGAVRNVDFDTLRDLIYEEGVEYMFKEGILGIDDMDTKKELGLEPENAVEPTNIIIFDEKTMNRMLKFMPYEEFVTKVDSAPREQVQNLVDYAIDNECLDMDKCEYLKKKTGIDAISAIRLRRQAKEPVKSK